MNLRVYLCCVRQRRVDPRREDYSLAVWRLKAHVDRSLPGVQVQCRDVEHQQAGELEAELLEHPPDLLGLSCYVWNVCTLAAMATRLRQAHPRMKIIAGGPAALHFTRPPGDAGGPPVDCVVPGEGEAALLEIIEALHNGGPHALAQVSGLLLCHDGSPQATPPRPPVADLDSLASPHAAGLLVPRQEMLVELARGCGQGCSFCSVTTLYGRTVRRFSPDYVAAELRLARQLEVQRVSLIESTINLRKTRLQAVRDVLAEVDPEGRLSYHMELNPDLLDPSQLKILASVPGRLQIGFGLQSMDPRVLRALGRPPHRADLDQLLVQLSQVGEGLVEIMLGLPRQTPESYYQTLDYALELGTSILAFRTIVAPGTGLWQRARELGLRYDPQTFLVQRTPTFSAEELERAEQVTIDRLARASARRRGFYAAYTASDERMHSFEPR